MAGHTILKITHAFFQMFCLNLKLIVLMTALAGIRCEIRRMARDARDRPAFAVIYREGVSSVERGGTPDRSGVAGGAICAEETGMEERVGVTTRARRRCPFEHVIAMTIRARHIGMRPIQFERGQVVIESRGRPSLRRVTGRAIRAKASDVDVI